MVSVILGLISIICAGALYPVSMQSQTFALILGGLSLVFAVLGFVKSRQSAGSDKDQTNNKEGMWLSVAGAVLVLIVGIIVYLVK